MRFIRVDLPEPEGPMMATYSLRRMRMSTAAQRVDLLIAHLVGLPEIVGDDDIPGMGTVGVGADAILCRCNDFGGVDGHGCLRENSRRKTLAGAVVRNSDRGDRIIAFHGNATSKRA